MCNYAVVVKVDVCDLYTLDNNRKCRKVSVVILLIIALELYNWDTTKGYSLAFSVIEMFKSLKAI